MAEGYLGEIRIWPMANKVPLNWMACNGSLLNISDYTALFAVLATQYGGDGKNTFGLPNLQGRLPIHTGQGPGLQNYALASSGGSDVVTLTAAQLPAHTHAFTVAGTAGTTNTLAANSVLSQVPTGANLYSTAVATPSAVMTPLTTAGSGGAHDNTMPSMALTYIICVVGLYPSRPN